MEVLARIGAPFLRSYRNTEAKRKEYQGMGLGLFIAKTLLNRSGAKLHFENSNGARVIVRWNTADLPKRDKVLAINPRVKF